ncbi:MULTISPECIES: KGK domain-containing protein [Cyanophyceae]|uniref:KGK domain-containing protein n=1 Tax=Cyanophyceae TaxID=3028117 RepID=UPI0016822E67|nr:KGK domain-containing protein [Trichocoleus sp. FACHB-40]MBD2003172.1 hypothetical protein [Trichocoleus sp. FACHB-40]
MENWIDVIDFNEDDVFSFPELFKVGKVRKAVNEASHTDSVVEALIYSLSFKQVSINKIDNLQPHNILFNKGIDCEILRIGAKGWKKGRLRLKLQVSVEFCPDEPDAEETGEISQPDSPLDDLRKIIN